MNQSFFDELEKIAVTKPWVKKQIFSAISKGIPEKRVHQFTRNMEGKGLQPRYTAAGRSPFSGSEVAEYAQAALKKKLRDKNPKLEWALRHQKPGRDPKSLRKWVGLPSTKTAMSHMEPEIPDMPDPHRYDDVGDNYVTKERLKRLGKAMLAVGIGGGLGGALGLAVGRKLKSPWGVRRGLNTPDWLTEYGPMAAGVLGGAGAMIPLLKDPKKYIKHGDKPK